MTDATPCNCALCGKPIEDDSIAIIWRIPGADRLIHTPCAAEALYLTVKLSDSEVSGKSD